MPNDREIAEALVYLRDALMEAQDTCPNYETVVESLKQALQFLGDNSYE
jgi:hypothetical protein